MRTHKQTNLEEKNWESRDLRRLKIRKQVKASILQIKTKGKRDFLLIIIIINIFLIIINRYDVP